MKPLVTDKDKLREFRERIKTVMSAMRAGGSEVRVVSDGVILSGTHTLHFEIRTKDFYFSGQIARRV